MREMGRRKRQEAGKWRYEWGAHATCVRMCVRARVRACVRCVRSIPHRQHRNTDVYVYTMLLEPRNHWYLLRYNMVSNPLLRVDL